LLVKLANFANLGKIKILKKQINIRMRTFVAIEVIVQQCFAESLERIKYELRFEQIKWVDFKSLHLTLFFLGQTTHDDTELIENFFKTQLSKFMKFKLQLKSYGTFGSKLNPKVLWVGVVVTDELLKLHQKVNESIQSIGFVSDIRGFNPHITIGRIKKVGDLNLINRLLKDHVNSIFQEMVVDKVILYRSDSWPSSVIYTPIISQELNG
jgi:RNA 2',3'-cyclic 3'-phosphodiesterase